MLQNTNDIELRRIKVNKLLKKGTDAKELRFETEKCYKMIEDAYNIAKQEPIVPHPWTAISAYRLAHIKLRTTKITKKDLEDIDKLFEEACRADCLGPKPYIYRISVIHRLKKYYDEELYDQLLSELFDDAISNLNNHIPSGFTNNRLLRGLQAEPFNLLEIAAYFTGHSYDQLIGRGKPLRHFSEITDSRAFILIGHNPSVSEVAYPESFALEELESRSSNNPGALIFNYKIRQNQSCWKIAGKTDWEICSSSELKLLCHLLYRKENEKDAFIHTVFGAGDNYDAYRTNKLRLKNSLAKLLNIDVNKVFVNDKPNLIPFINPEIDIVGITAMRDL